MTTPLRLREKLRTMLAEAADMTIATVGADGEPHASTVSYVSDGLSLYFGCSSHSRKARNIGAAATVAATVNLPYRTWDEIRGLSFTGRAERLTDARDVALAARLMTERYPALLDAVFPDGQAVAMFRVVPERVSVLDYTKGLGHLDYIDLRRGADIDEPAEPGFGNRPAVRPH